MARHTDTIAALATPAGTSALATIRISGPDTKRLAGEIFGSVPPARVATHGDFADRSGLVVDDVVATLFAGPHSYTGEDSLEISCHGSPFIARKILADLLSRGCRPAGPGEFTQRAFLNGRMDLSQAEAVMDLINARSERALAAARQVLRGALSRHMAELVDGLLGTLAMVEAYIDFPDEDLPPEDRSRLGERVSAVLRRNQLLLATERKGALPREGARCSTGLSAANGRSSAPSPEPPATSSRNASLSVRTAFSWSTRRDSIPMQGGSRCSGWKRRLRTRPAPTFSFSSSTRPAPPLRSEEHTSELQS